MINGIAYEGLIDGTDKSKVRLEKLIPFIREQKRNEIPEELMKAKISFIHYLFPDSKLYKTYNNVSFMQEGNSIPIESDNKMRIKICFRRESMDICVDELKHEFYKNPILTESERLKEVFRKKILDNKSEEVHCIIHDYNDRLEVLVRTVLEDEEMIDVLQDAYIAFAKQQATTLNQGESIKYIPFFMY